MNTKIKLFALTVALLTVTACGAPAAGTPSSSGANAGDKAATGFTLTVPMQYDSAAPFSDGLALVGTGTNESMQYSYIDPTGKKVLELAPGVSGDSFANGLAMVYKMEQGISAVNIIDKTGKELLDSWARDFRGMGGGGDGNSAARVIYFGVSKTSALPKYFSLQSLDSISSALLNSNAQIVIPFGTYSSLQMVPDTDFVIATTISNDNWLSGVLKTDGTTFVDCKYSDIGAAGNIGFVVREAGSDHCSLLLYDGTLIDVEGYKAEYMLVSEDGKIYFQTSETDGSTKYGEIDKTGKLIGALSTDNPSSGTRVDFGMPDTSYSSAVAPAGLETLSCDDRYQIVATGKEFDANYELIPDVKAGLADITGKTILVEPTHEAISLPYGGIYVTAGGFVMSEYGYVPTDYTLVSLDGKAKSDVYKNYHYISDGMVAVSDGTKWGYVTVSY